MIVRTNIVIDDDLIDEALRVTGLKTKRQVVEVALKRLLHLKKQESVKIYFGKIPWDGELKSLRRAR